MTMMMPKVNHTQIRIDYVVNSIVFQISIPRIFFLEIFVLLSVNLKIYAKFYFLD